MKKIKNKYIILILSILLASVIIYLFMPLSLEIRYGFKDQIPDKIIVSKIGVDENGRPLMESIEIEDRNNISDIYELLKELKLSKSFRSSKHFNQYVINIINYDDRENVIKDLSLAEDLLYIKGVNYRIVASQNITQEIENILENKFNQ